MKGKTQSHRQTDNDITTHTTHYKKKVENKINNKYKNKKDLRDRQMQALAGFQNLKLIFELKTQLYLTLLMLLTLPFTAYLRHPPITTHTQRQTVALSLSLSPSLLEPS